MTMIIKFLPLVPYLSNSEWSEWDESHRRQSRKGRGDGVRATTEFQTKESNSEFPDFLSGHLPLSSAHRDESCLRPPSVSLPAIRFVIRFESSPQRWLLVEHHEEMSREEKHARINQHR